MNYEDIGLLIFSVSVISMIAVAGLYLTGRESENRIALSNCQQFGQFAIDDIIYTCEEVNE